MEGTLVPKGFYLRKRELDLIPFYDLSDDAVVIIFSLVDFLRLGLIFILCSTLSCWSILKNPLESIYPECPSKWNPYRELLLFSSFPILTHYYLVKWLLERFR